ncbi:MAG: nucleotide exchange factor GrpE [Bacteroidales bacterium]
MTKEKNMKSEEKKNQEQLNTEETQEQTQQQAQEEQGKETIAQETTEETSQGEEKQKGASQKKEKSKKKEGKKSAEDKEKKKEEQEQEQEQEQKQEEAEAQQEEEKKEEKSDKEKLAELQDKYLRLTAEYDNYRKRTLKEKMELTKSAGEDILKGLLPIMDDFERALQSIDEAGDIQAVKDGVYLIYNKFKDFLNQQGVKEIEAQDKDFDTDKHEAVSKVPAQNEELKGKVVDVVQKGYYLNDKVLRYAKVVVGE